MYNILTLVIVVSYIVLLTMSAITFIYVINHHKDYGSKFKAFLNVTIVSTIGIIYSTFLLFSLVLYFSDSINILLWKISTVLNIITLGLVLLIVVFLKERRKLFIIPLIIYSIMLGLLIGVLSSSNSVQIELNPSSSAPAIITDLSIINYIYDLPTKIILLIFYTIIVLDLGYMALNVYKNARNKKIAKIFLLTFFSFAAPQVLFILYIIFSFQILRELHFIILSIIFLGVARFLILKPEMTLNLTNKVYAINIYHKSGILLFSYEIEYEKIRTETEIWGNILIGLNHIVGEFISENNQIDMLQTKNSDIIVNYNNEYGFAVLVLTNSKNIILSNMLNEFAREFKEKYKKELTDIQDLNNLIDASEFLDVEKIIKKHFSIYF